MSITAGSDIVAADFVSTSSGAGDSGKVVKLNSAGRIDRPFLQASFGGTGADGALSITSGTTTINLGGAQVYVKNYTSISITGTGVLAFSNPHASGTIIILKSQGNVTITSSANPAIDVRGMGGAGGGAGGDGLGAGGSGTNGSCFDGATNGGTCTTGGGVAGAAYSPIFINSIFGKKIHLLCGAGGGGGYGGSSTGGPRVGGAGGNGGGALYIECAGALNFTGIIDASGLNGGSGTAAGVQRYGGSAGAGGGGGTIMILYNTLTANSGTLTVNGGGAGSAGTGGSGVGSGAFTSGGGAGGAGYTAGTAGGANNGYDGGVGGTGGTGLSLVAANTEFV